MALSAKENIQISKLLSLVLRHQPEVIGITLDEHGWADVSTLIQKVNQHGTAIDFSILKEIVETNAKKRFAFNGTSDKIRASQGHSVNIELGYKPSPPPLILYHGTADRFVDSIQKLGLIKGSR